MVFHFFYVMLGSSRLKKSSGLISARTSWLPVSITWCSWVPVKELGNSKDSRRFCVCYAGEYDIMVFHPISEG